MTHVDPEIDWYYRKGHEATRLATRCQLEEARTRRIIEKRLPEGPQDIVDIGGGAGAYAFWLAAQGHAVHLVDPVDLHISQARTIAKESKLRLQGLYRADASSLPFPDEMFDAALSFGPLYHVTERENRIATLREAYRVLRPGGTLFAAAINRYAMAIDGFFKGYVADALFEETMKTSTRDGQHRNPMRRDGLFTTAYFHRPEELGSELEKSGFRQIELLAIEGPWPCIPEFERKWNDHRFRALLMDVIEQMEADPTVIGFGGHLMAVGRRPRRRRKRAPELRQRTPRPAKPRKRKKTVD